MSALKARTLSPPTSGASSQDSRWGISRDPQIRLRLASGLVSAENSARKAGARGSSGPLQETSLSHLTLHPTTKPLSSQRLLQPPLLARLEVERMLLNLLDDVLLLHLALEAPKCALDGLSLIDDDQRHSTLSLLEDSHASRKRSLYQSRLGPVKKVRRPARHPT